MSVQHWLSCCSTGMKTAAVTGCAVFEYGEMEAFGNRHRICHVKKALLNTSKMGCRMRPELKRPHLLPP